MKVYIAGPMSGYVDHNFPAFHAAAARLRLLGYEPVNPAEMDGDLTQDELAEIPHEVFMRRDIRALVDCDSIYFLPGWKHSKGATGEKAVADLCGIVEVRDPNVALWRTFEGEPLVESEVDDGEVALSDVLRDLTEAADAFHPTDDVCPTFHTFVAPCKLAKEFKAAYTKVLPEDGEVPQPGPIVTHVVEGQRPNHQFFGVEYVGDGNREDAEARGLDELAARRLVAAAERPECKRLAAEQYKPGDAFPNVGYVRHMTGKAAAELAQDDEQFEMGVE